MRPPFDFYLTVFFFTESTSSSEAILITSVEDMDIEMKHDRDMDMEVERIYMMQAEDNKKAYLRN